jgi:hypothetical protein
MSMTVKIRLLFISAFLSVFLTSYGQPESYWSVSFNTDASLLSGAVVGGNSGIASIYYNPAGISEIKNQQFALNANLFSLEYSNYSNAIGGENDLSNLAFRVQPRFVSYLYRSKKDTTLSIQFAIFNRNISKVDMYKSVDYNTSLINEGINENYFGNFDIVSDYTDYWGGAGVSYELSPKLSIGASLFFSVKNFTYFKSIGALVNPVADELPDSVLYYESTWASYQKLVMYDVRMLGKIGFRYHAGDWSYGLNFTIPSLRLFGNGDVKKIISQANIPGSDIVTDDYNYHEVGNYMLAQFKDPFSVAIGVVYVRPSKRSRYYFSAEYFNKIDKYKTVDGTKNVSPDDAYPIPTTDFLSYYYAARAVVNIALGYQIKMTENTEGMFGFRTNFNPRKEIFDNPVLQGGMEFSVVPANLYYITGGTTFKYKKTSFLVGLQLAVGNKRDNIQFVNFYNPVVSDPSTGLSIQGKRKYDMDYTFIGASLFLGFSIGY